MATIKPTLAAGLLCAMLGGAQAASQDQSELDALALADAGPAPTAGETGPYRVTLELGAGQSRQRAGGSQSSLHGALVLRIDQQLAPQWRYMLDYRFDADGEPGQGIQRDNLHGALREGYLTRQMGSDTWLDIGRINVKSGVAMGYNPTDYFRANAQLNSYTPDPAALRDYRLGTVAVRLQRLWDTGSVSLMVSPKLAGRPHDGVFNLALDRTNPVTRWQLRSSLKLNEALAPEFSLYHQAGQPLERLRAGFNLSALVQPDMSAYIEWSGARAPSLAQQALQPPLSPEGAAPAGPGLRFRQQAAFGINWNPMAKLALMTEYMVNQTGLGREAWRTLGAARDAGVADYWRVRSLAASSQNPVTRQAWLVRASWQDALAPHADLTAFVRGNPYDSSRMAWVEARYHFNKTDLALAFSHFQGKASSEFGALPASKALSLNLIHYQ